MSCGPLARHCAITFRDCRAFVDAANAVGAVSPFRFNTLGNGRPWAWVELTELLCIRALLGSATLS
jgi:hypothetical protein